MLFFAEESDICDFLVFDFFADVLSFKLTLYTANFRGPSGVRQSKMNKLPWGNHVCQIKGCTLSNLSELIVITSGHNRTPVF